MRVLATRARALPSRDNVGRKRTGHEVLAHGASQLTHFHFSESDSMARASNAICCPAPAKTLAASRRHVASLKALAHLGRLRVFFHLVQAESPLAVGEIRRSLRLPAPTLSHHLNALERAGLIFRRKQDRCIYSEVRREAVTDLVRLLTACC